MQNIREDIKRAQRIVVKIGTSTVTYDTGKLNLKRLDQLARVLSDLHNEGKEIILVSSGAVGIAIGKLGLTEQPKDIRSRQALAAVGQCELMYLYDKLFGDYNTMVAQILLTRDDIVIPRRKRNMQNTFYALMEMGMIPVVNENDTVSVEEIEIGDNDTLSAVVADLIDADLLVLFSDIDGLYDGDPHTCNDVQLLPIVFDIDKVKHLAGGVGSNRGTGGMVTKLAAADIATRAGIHMVIANGNDIAALYRLLDGEPVGTLFVSKNFSENEEEII